MDQFLKPAWVYLTTALPCVILAFLFGSSFQVIRTLLSKDNKTAWILFGAALLAMNAGFSGYAFYKQTRKEKINPLLGFFIVAAHISFVYVFLCNSAKVIPFSVPRWMLYEGDLTLYVFTFLMPGIAYGLLLAVLRFTQAGRIHKKLFNVFPLVAVPLFLYLLLNIVVPAVSSKISYRIFQHAMLILTISATLLFLFFLVRLVYLLAIDKKWGSATVVLAVQSVFLIVLPVACFIVNKRLDSFAGPNGGGVFGNFSNPLFYVFAVINGLLYMAPAPKGKVLRVALFFGRCATYSLVVYFFFVLLPFFPLSILALIAFGFGFLMLAPIIVMVMTTDTLIKDFRYFSGHYHVIVVVLLFCSGFMLMPGYLVYRFSLDKKSLHGALDYLYSPNFSDLSEKELNLPKFLKTLDVIKENKDMQGRNPGKRKPYISPFYEWYVLGNLTLSDKKIRDLDRVFTGTSNIKTVWSEREALQRPTAFPPKITKVVIDDDGNQPYRSTWVHLEITNGQDDFTEYSTSFSLPEGCWISDYYLEIGGKREYGILAEKKTATWIYQQITTRENRDPGILFYTDGRNRVNLKVFPFSAKETRKTGFRIDHIEPFDFTVDGNHIASSAAGPLKKDVLVDQNGLGFFISTCKKKSLPIAMRQPYYHFIIDCSKSTEGEFDEFEKRIDTAVAKHPLSGGEPSVTFMNYHGKTVDFKTWKDEYKAFPKEGGFFLEKALKYILGTAYNRQEERYPIPIVVADRIDSAIVLGEFFGFVGLVPEIDRFFVLERDGNFSAHPFSKAYKTVVDSNCTFRPIASRILTNSEGKNCYLADDSNPSILPVSHPNQRLTPSPGNRWLAGLQLCLFEKNSELFPCNIDEHWFSIVKGSLSSHIMTHQTSFIALENESQKQALLKKQKKVLSAKKMLDIGEESRMSEPSFWLLLCMAVSILAVFRRKKMLQCKQDK